MDDWENAKTIEECTEMATVDCYGEYEQAGGWCCCLGDIFADVKKIKVLGEEVKLKKLDLVNDLNVVVVCEKRGKTIKVTLDSIELINPTKAQGLWLEAWLKWSEY